MKTFLTTFILSFLLVSCGKNRANKHSTASQSQNTIKKEVFVIDSVRVTETRAISKMVSHYFNKQLLVFPSIKNKTILDSIYKNELIKLSIYDKNSLKATLQKQILSTCASYKEDADEWEPTYQQYWDESSEMTVASHKDDILTIVYTGTGYTGGAHGYYYEKYKVFDLNSNRVIQTEDVFNNPKDKIWNKIFDTYFNVPEQKEMLLVDEILPNNNFYFDEKGITFVYNQYEITAYAAGVVYITIPFKEIKNLLKPEFIKLYNIK